jgi:Fic family protein
MPPVSYHLGKFPPADLDWSRLIPLLGPASAGLARYDALLTAIPNASVLLSPLTTQEAVLSSRIEGTEATMGDVLQVEAGGEPEKFDEDKRGDVEEIMNYRRAMRESVEALRQLPLSQRLLKKAHSTLLQGVRGTNKDPGNYRRIENWIGPKGCTRQEASFIPVGPEFLQESMGKWELFLHADFPDRLVQLAVAHVEFEALHPFLDGNGRLGRMLIPLFLFEKELLSSPDFYMSAYFEAHRDEYYERLRAVSATGDWTGWCAFFLQAVIRQTAENEQKARAILGLYHDIKNTVVDLTHSQHAIRAVDFLFKMPIFQAPHFAGEAAIPSPTAKRILGLLREHGILSVLREPKGRRPGILAFKTLLNIAEGRDAF